MIAKAPGFKAPFPYFGGKSRVAAEVWSRFGDVRNFVEPFFGTGAVLFARPHWPFPDEDANRVETVNDANAYLANFWRALQHDPEAVAHHADWPVNEIDLHARHRWLVNVGVDVVEKLRTDPDFFDAKCAGWWVWGAAQWIGRGWCDGPGKRDRRPHLGRTGMGVHRSTSTDIHGYLASLADRLRRVRVCCGDWSRVCGQTPTTYLGLTAVFLDPPYTAEAGRDPGCYATDSLTVGHDVAKWAIEHGDDPLMRIALCGYEGEYAIPDSWECFAWKAHGGYAVQNKNADTAGKANKHRERIWFSPHCLRPESAAARPLLEGVA